MTTTRRKFIQQVGSGAATGIFAANFQETGSATPNQSTAEEKDDPVTDLSSNQVYFVARTPYNVPNGRQIIRLEADSVFDWFQKHWGSQQTFHELLGSRHYGLNALEKVDGRPTTEEELAQYLEKQGYCTSCQMKDGVIEFVTDDDEFHLDYYWLDQKFIDGHPDRVDFLMQENWLPQQVDSNIESEPVTYLASRIPSQTCDSDLWDFFEISGVRLNQIGNVYEVMKATRGSDSAILEQFLESVAPKSTWPQVIAKFVTKHASFIGNESTFQCSRHVCELNFHEATYTTGVNKQELFGQFVVFDDLWAATYPDLVSSMRRLAKSKILFAD